MMWQYECDDFPAETGFMIDFGTSLANLPDYCETFMEGRKLL